MNHLLEALFSIVGVLFTIAKVISTFKAFLWGEKIVEPYVKKVLINERASYLRGHIFEQHSTDIKQCVEGQCVSLA